MTTQSIGTLRRIVSAFWFLQSRSLKNQLSVRLKRLKQPKYLIGALVGIGYLFISALPALFGAFKGIKTHGGGHAAANGANLWQGLVGAGLLVWMALNWIIPSTGAALQFSEAELAFLLPAPIGRRTLIQYRLLRSLLPLLATSVFFTIFRVGSSSSPILVRLFGWWLVMILLQLHAIAASFTMTRLFDRGVTPWWRRSLVLTLIAAVAGASFWWMNRNTPDLAITKDNFTEGTAWVRALLATPPLSWVLTPINWVIAPRFSHSIAEFLVRLPAALLVVGLHYLWVIRTEVAFEEASLAAARKRSDIISAVRQGRHPLSLGKRKKIHSPFRLAPTGFPPMALLWKNLISAGSGFSSRWFIILAVTMAFSAFALVGAASAGGRTGAIAMVFGFSVAMFGMSLLVGPQLLRFDFRQDLQAIDLVKLYPLPGWQVVLGEMLAPAVVLTCIQWLLLILIGGLSLDTGTGDSGYFGVAAWERILIILCAALIVPGFNLISLVVPNALTLLFPAWVQAGKEGPMGLEVMGQRMIIGIGGLIIIAVGLIPASLVFGLLTWASTLVLTWHVGVIAGTFAAAGILLAEAAVAIAMLGKMFEKLDLT